MALKIEYAPGATPLDPEEMAGLIPAGISTRSQLDEYESANITDGMRWAGTKIHAFPNGNGRHARMMTDFLLEQLGERPFAWGAVRLVRGPE